MTSNLKVVGISQVVMFADNLQVTQLILERDGKEEQVAVPISDDQALEIINFATGVEHGEQEPLGSPVSKETEAGVQL